MSRFGPDPQAFFESVYQQTPPWDIGGPQPALEALLDELRIVAVFEDLYGNR